MPVEQIQLWIAHYGYGAIVLLLMFGILGLPIPDETLLTLVGYLVSTGTLHPVLSFVSAFVGTTCGITLSYGIGRFGGIRLLRRYGKRIGGTPERIERVRQWFHRRGRWALTLGYFVPGVRHVIAIVAGSSGVGLRHFMVSAYSGAAVWTLFFLSAGYFLGRSWERFPGVMHVVAFSVVVGGLLSYGVYWFVRSRRSN